MIMFLYLGIVFISPNGKGLYELFSSRKEEYLMLDFKFFNGLTVSVNWLVSSFDVQLFFNGKRLEESRGDDDFDIDGLCDLDSLQLSKLLENCQSLDKHLVEQFVKDERVYIEVSKGIK